MNTRLREVRNTLLYGLVLAVLAVGVVEVGLRMRQASKYGAFGTLQRNIKDEKSGIDIPTPGELKGSAISIKVNSLGFRGDEIETPKPEGRVRLAFIGSSTTFCAEVSSNEMVWPHLVTKALAEQHPGLDFDYVNASIPGVEVAIGKRNLEHRVKPHAPDVVVIYEATNDLSKDSRELAKQVGLPTQHVQSWLATKSLTWDLIEKQFWIRNLQAGAHSPEGRLVYEPRALSAGFRNRLRALIDSAKEIAPVVAVATFSHKLRRDHSPEEQVRTANTALYYMPYMTIEGLLAGYEEYNRVIREVAQETGVILIEDEYGIPGDDLHFADSVHFTDAGSKKMSERVVRALESAEPFLAFIRPREVTHAKAGER